MLQYLRYGRSISDRSKRKGGKIEMFDEFGKEDDQWRPEIPKYRRVLFQIFRVLFVGFVFFLIALMVVRLISSKPPASMKKMIWNDTARAAYAEMGDDFKVERILSSDSFSKDSMFSVDMITYAESIGQLQFTVRYNDRVLRYLEQDYPGATEATKGTETYVFVLKDNLGNVYTDYEYVSDARSGYTYRHLIFDNVTIEDVTEIKLHVYYAGDVQTEIDGRHVLYAFRSDFARSEYLLS